MLGKWKDPEGTCLWWGSISCHECHQRPSQPSVCRKARRVLLRQAKEVMSWELVGMEVGVRSEGQQKK